MAEPTELSARVVGISTKLDRLSGSVDKRFEQVERRFEAVLKEIAAEGEKTRRHLDVVAEPMNSEPLPPTDKAAAASETPYS